MASKMQKLPGLDALGCGYQTVTGEFASIDSCEEQLFDFEKLEYREFVSVATGKTYCFPKSFVQYIDENVRDSYTVSGETVEEFIDKLSVSVEIGGKYKGFEGSVRSEFKNSSEFSRFEAYTRYQCNVTLWKLSLDDSSGEHRDFLKEKVRKDINNLNPEDLYDRYGTHYVNTIKVGGRCVSSAVTNKLKSNKTQSFGVYLQAKFESEVFGASASTDVTKESEYKSFRENSRFLTKITGGDPLAFGFDSAPKFTDWAKTIRDHPMMIDFDKRQGIIGFLMLLPIWKLAETEQRKQQLKDAMTTYFETHRLGFKVSEGPALEGRWVTARVQYNDAGSRAVKAFTVFKPELAEGWYWLGQRGYGPQYLGNETFKTLVVRPKPWATGILCPMRSYSKIWSDAGSENYDTDFNIWRPVPEDPVNYVPLGHFFKNADDNQGEPTGAATERLMAVHRAIVLPATIGDKLWDDHTTKSSSDVVDGSAWKIDAPSGGVDCGFWIGYQSHSKPDNTDVYCLQEKAIHYIEP